MQINEQFEESDNEASRREVIGAAIKRSGPLKRCIVVRGEASECENAELLCK